MVSFMIRKAVVFVGCVVALLVAATLVTLTYLLSDGERV